MKIKILIFAILVIILCGIFFVFNINQHSSKQLELTYKTNGGVPFKWEYEIEDKNVVKFVKSYIKKDQNKKDMVGAPIYTSYIFKGLKKGKTTITFKYINITDGTIEKIEKNNIKVDNDKNILLEKNNNN